MRVLEMAKRTNVTPHAVRFYARLGLLQPKRTKRNQYREFADTDVTRLQFIRKARGLGFTLGEIAEIIARSSRHRTQCPTVRDIVRRRIAETGQYLGDLVRLRNDMKRALAKWEKMPDGAPNGSEICRLIESVETGAFTRTSRRNSRCQVGESGTTPRSATRP